MIDKWAMLFLIRVNSRCPQSSHRHRLDLTEESDNQHRDHLSGINCKTNWKASIITQLRANNRSRCRMGIELKVKPG